MADDDNPPEWGETANPDFRKTAIDAFSRDGTTCPGCGRLKMIHFVCGWFYAWCFCRDKE